MFLASLCPSSGALDHMLLHMVCITGCAGWSLGKPGSRPCALSANGLLSTYPRLQPAHLVLKTICSNIRSSAPEDGHNDA
jgi:hypothetical protein